MSDVKIEEKFQINIDPGPPMMAFVILPIGRYIDDREDGMALMHGKLREAEANLSKFMLRERQKKVAVGVIGPDGKPVVN